jgi:hypothetical protein
VGAPVPEAAPGGPLNLTHLPDGRSIGDTAVMVALTARPAGTIRRHCHRLDDGYDIAACTETLATAPDPLLLTARQAQQYLGIPSGTVYSWASRRQLHSLAHDGNGRPLYDVADLLRLNEGDQP